MQKSHLRTIPLFQREVPLAGRRLRQDSPPEESGEVDFQPRRDVKMQWHYFLLCDISNLPFALKPTVVNLNFGRSSEMQLHSYPKNESACCPR